eukprot:362523-Chlamydomonas_euryale.AAC.2
MEVVDVATQIAVHHRRTLATWLVDKQLGAYLKRTGAGDSQRDLPCNVTLIAYCRTAPDLRLICGFHIGCIKPTGTHTTCVGVQDSRVVLLQHNQLQTLKCLPPAPSTRVSAVQNLYNSYKQLLSPVEGIRGRPEMGRLHVGKDNQTRAAHAPPPSIM